MIKSIFFDQDNTLVNTRVVAGETYRKAIDWVSAQKKVNANGLYQEWRKVLDVLKNSTKPEERQFSHSLGLVVPEKDLVEKAVEKQEKKLGHLIQTNPGVIEFFELDKADRKYILFTEDSETRMRLKLEKFDLVNKFDLILNSDTLNLMKPNIKFMEIAWEKLNLDPKECLYIGDNYDKDCRIGVENGGKALVYGKDFTDFGQLEGILSTWNQQ
jgi:putative hydrolase of the HAD superfamily